MVSTIVPYKILSSILHVHVYIVVNCGKIIHYCMHPKLTDDIPVGKVHKLYDIVCSEI